MDKTIWYPNYIAWLAHSIKSNLNLIHNNIFPTTVTLNMVDATPLSRRPKSRLRNVITVKVVGETKDDG